MAINTREKLEKLSPEDKLDFIEMTIGAEFFGDIKNPAEVKAFLDNLWEETVQQYIELECEFESI